ncbi:GNAT family N-acetyltransferase [Viridibacillus sp. YIM B01967]|uniref:GNAT family N-acetyltransferase n=1 Tax=Viridibacillus soli TaxID=2798301 RepID=A0ABS1H4L8_9BACL|nr:GNAT family N-acetyltransferase [Viridibacillus soli]MBK3494241.1 GNAT family N-acetyltransferase [Viridibacillus soli]
MQSLKRMSEEDFILYIQDKEVRFAEVLAENVHEYSENPKIRAQKQLSNILPQGYHTINHEFYMIEKEKNIIGYVWLKIEEQKKSAFLYEIYIFDSQRSKGIGKTVMKEIEDYIAEKGICYFKLHVFGTNTGAIKLYDELGFEVAGLNMLKKI